MGGGGSNNNVKPYHTFQPYNYSELLVQHNYYNTTITNNFHFEPHFSEFHEKIVHIYFIKFDNI